MAAAQETGRLVRPSRDGKCSIYDQRPRSCRLFDCRIALLTGAFPEDDPVMDAALFSWAPPTTPTVEDRDVAVAIRMAVADGGMPTSQGEVHRRFLGFPEYLPAARAFRRKLDALRPKSDPGSQNEDRGEKTCERLANEFGVGAPPPHAEPWRKVRSEVPRLTP